MLPKYLRPARDLHGNITLRSSGIRNELGEAAEKPHEVKLTGRVSCPRASDVLSVAAHHHFCHVPRCSFDGVHGPRDLPSAGDTFALFAPGLRDFLRAFMGDITRFACPRQTDAWRGVLNSGFHSSCRCQNV